MNFNSSKIVTTGDGSLTVMHPQLGETYHSHAGARLEAHDLYVAGSGFKGQLSDTSRDLAVLDVGLGLGYNAMATMNEWDSQLKPPNLTICSLENDVELFETLLSAEAPWQENWSNEELSNIRALQQSSSQCWRLTRQHPTWPTSTLNWTVYLGDAQQFDSRLEDPAKCFDFIWQDPFSPQKNPDMWGKEWFNQLAKHSTQQTILVTYSVARTVKDALKSADWQWCLLPTTTQKRHWLLAKRPQSAYESVVIH